MKKFVVGDLVTLSASGQKNKHNDGVYGKIGIIRRIRTHASYPIDIQWIAHASYPIDIQWIGLMGGHGHANDRFPMKEYEIKFVKNGVVPCE